MNDDLIHLQHIDESIRLIQEWTRGSKAVLLNDVTVRDAVLRRIQTLAESTTKLSAEIQQEFPHIDWRGIAGFRNIVAHNYTNIDLDITWNILLRYLPELHEVIKTVLGRSETS